MKEVTNNIVNIIISKLFGLYDYNFLEQNDNKDVTELMILYGDNGCGKTTILKSIYYLLSTIDKEGHKSALAAIKFSSFSIKLSSGIIIKARRENNNLIGSYFYEIFQGKKKKYSVFLECKQNYSIQLDEGSEENTEYLAILKYISSLNITIYYLSDERKILESLFFKPNESRNKSRIEKEYYMQRLLTREGLFEIQEENEETSIIFVIKKVEKFLQDQVITASKKGEKDSNDIYEDIIYRIEKEANINNNEIIAKITNLKKIISEIYVQSEKYSELGLIEKFNEQKIISAFSTTDKNKEIIINVMEPYIDSLKAKLQAMTAVYNLIITLLDYVNKYYFSNKKIFYNLNRGFFIFNKNNEEIEPNSLSSGEKQLLLLLFHTILASQKASIFIIDEPEISLNIKWQRKLIDTLLALNLTNRIQFIIASHSIEILASHDNNIIKLENN